MSLVLVAASALAGPRTVPVGAPGEGAALQPSLEALGGDVQRRFARARFCVVDFEGSIPRGGR